MPLRGCIHAFKEFCWRDCCFFVSHPTLIYLQLLKKIFLLLRANTDTSCISKTVTVAHVVVIQSFMYGRRGAEV